VLGVTDSDCYAGKLNFVFGMADVGGGTALVSLCRLRAGATAGLFLARAMKEIIHELGHARGLGHCASSRCVMHFSNSLAETDAKDEQLCAACVQRLRK
jgi:archaemetzincin